MLHLIVVLALATGEPATKQLPPVVEPDWSTWKDVEPKKKKQAMDAWDVLRAHRPERDYASDEELKAAKKAVDDAYRALDAMPDAACATGAELLQNAKDDWERMVFAGTISASGGEKGEPFLLRAWAKCTTLDDQLDGCFGIACRLAAERRPENLPALFLLLRTHEGSVYLPIHSWYIQTHDCLYYVFGRYGREAIPYLRPMLEHAAPYVRRNAAIVLGLFMDQPSKPALLKMLAANDVGSGGAAFALGELGAIDAVEPIARLLKNSDTRTRFRAAYALYEIGSNDAVPALEAALAVEKDDATRDEEQNAIDYLRSGPKPLGAGARQLGRDELREALQAARKANGLDGDIAAIAASAGQAELELLEEIRLKTMDIASDKGNKWFKRWTEVIKTIQRRGE